MFVNLINTLPQPLKIASKFVIHNEQASGLSTSRFIQDTGTCLLPKAVFARSKEDLAENTFLELSESGLVYFVPGVVGSIAQKAYSKKLPSDLKKMVVSDTASLVKSNSNLKKTILPIKAAIALCALFIPLAEFTLNYFKNLMTLKVFKKSDFNNIANLEKSHEDISSQKKVAKSAYKNISAATLAFVGALFSASVIAKKGSSSKALQNLSELVLLPGSKLFSNNKKLEKFFNKYFSLDFAVDNGKLCLSKGQLTSTVLIGGAGYFGASKDRGRQNFLETLFRFPIVGFYIITGSELFEKGFKKLLKKMGKCKETIGENLDTPSFKQLDDISSKIAREKMSSVESVYRKLAKQKVLIFGVPFLFGIGFMGFFVAGISNLFTRFRYNQGKKFDENSNIFVQQKLKTGTFETFFS